MSGNIVTVKAFAEGDTIYRSGEPGGTAFLVREGAVQINRADAGGAEKVAGYAGPGQIFGEEALLSNRERTATAIASKPSKCIAIDRSSLVKTLRNQDPFIAALFSILASNMQSMIDRGAELDCLLQDLSSVQDIDAPDTSTAAADAQERTSAPSRPAAKPGACKPVAGKPVPARSSEPAAAAAPSVATDAEEEEDDAFLI